MKIMSSRMIVFALLISGLSVGITSAEDTDKTEVTFSDLFRAEDIQSIELSPTGEFVAYRRDQEIRVGNTDLGYIRIYNFRKDERVRSIQWIGNSSLIVQTRNRVSGETKLHSSKMGPDENGDYAEIDWEHHTIEGYVDDVLLDDPNEIIFARIRREDEFVAADLFRIDVFAESKRCV